MSKISNDDKKWKKWAIRLRFSLKSFFISLPRCVRIQRGLGITKECIDGNVFFGNFGLKKQRGKATRRNRGTTAHYCDRNQFI